MVPQHLGIIPDGNRRWAKQKGFPAFKGHQVGVDVLRRTSRHAFDRGVQNVTYYAFSNENWKRATDEVGYLMTLFGQLIVSEMKELEERGVRFRLLGSRKRLDKSLLKKFEAAEERTRNNTSGTFALCLDYGGEQELADAAANLIRAGVAADEVTPERLAAELYAPDLPPVDFIIRTSGEHRLSGFMLWRAAYAELYFTEQFWPDFDEAAIDVALEDYAGRIRRFGA